MGAKRHGIEKTGNFWSHKNGGQIFLKAQTSFLVWSYLLKSWEDKSDTVEDCK
jgi:hypothetical protein